MVGFVGLLLEVGYTRIVSYKLWYYYTYLVIGLALLGIGSGGVFVALSSGCARGDRCGSSRVCSARRGRVIALGYLVVARTADRHAQPIWDYGIRSLQEPRTLLASSASLLFASFIGVGIMIVATLRADAGRRRAALLRRPLGAGLGCLVAVPLSAALGPPAVICSRRRLSSPAPASIAAALGSVARLAAGAVSPSSLAPGSSSPRAARRARRRRPRRRTAPTHARVRDWGSGLPGRRRRARRPGRRSCSTTACRARRSTRFDGDAAQPRPLRHRPPPLPFACSATHPSEELIIGSAGGNEILGVALLRRRPHRRRRAEPGDASSLLDRPLRRLHRPPHRRPRRRLHQRRRPLVPRAQRRAVRPHLVRRARQLRREQRRHRRAPSCSRRATSTRAR